MIKIKTIRVKGFKCFDDNEFTFGEENRITGGNGSGKTSIADLIAYTITGYSFFGEQKLDRFYTKGGEKLLEVELIYEKDKKVHSITRRRTKNTTEIYLDSCKTSQARLDDAFGGKDIFLSMFNPQYFNDVLKKEGRRLIESLLPSLSHKQILSKLDSVTQSVMEKIEFLSADAQLDELRRQKDALNSSALKLSGQREMLERQTVDIQKKMDEASEMLVKVKEEKAELEKLKQTDIDFDSRYQKLFSRKEKADKDPVHAELERLDAEIIRLQTEYEAVSRSEYSGSSRDKAILLEAQLKNKEQEYQELLKRKQSLVPGSQCPYCLAVLTENSITSVHRNYSAKERELFSGGQTLYQSYVKVLKDEEALKLSFDRQKEKKQLELSNLLQKLKADHKEIKLIFDEVDNEIKNDYAQLERSFRYGRMDEAQITQYEKLNRKEADLEAQILNFPDMASEMEALKNAEDDNQEKLEETERQLQALKTYINKKYELLFAETKMNQACITLFDVAKTTGEIRNTFRLDYKDTPYTWLSLSERMKAGLEVSDLIRRLTKINAPVFIDNAECLQFLENKPACQIFYAAVYSGSLQVQTVDYRQPDAA